MTDPILHAVLNRASHAMLRDAIERCPPEEWLNTSYKNAVWQLSYRTLFFAHL